MGAATLWVLPKIHFEPIVKPELPRQVPSKPKVSTHFKIALLLEVDATIAFKAREVFKKATKGRIGAGVSVMAGAFVIWDTENNPSCTYVYAAAGLGAGLAIPGAPVSGTTHGPWNFFTTEKPIGCSQFGPEARYTTIGAGSKSETWMLIETPPGVNDVYLSLETGTTLGAAAATYPAFLSAFKPLERPHPFNGP